MGFKERSGRYTRNISILVVKMKIGASLSKRLMELAGSMKVRQNMGLLKTCYLQLWAR